jgi:Lon protease-like protein
VDGAVAQRAGQRVVDEPVLLDERQPVEARARHDDLEMVAAAGAVLDPQLSRVGERVTQQVLEPLDGHVAIVLTALTSRVCAPAPGRPYPYSMELGLFPLAIVLLPTEQVPLHIFEPRYQELIGECLEDDTEFGLVYADDEGARELGTRAHVTEVLARFDDGRLDVLVEGGERFRVEHLTKGRAFITAVVLPVEDDPDPAPVEVAERAVGTFRAIAALAGVEPEVDESSPELSFRLAAQVELPPDDKQRLLESRSERERLELVAELLEAARKSVLAARELAERAKLNGSRG